MSSEDSIDSIEWSFISNVLILFLQIGCNAVSWAPALAPNSLFDQTGRPTPVKKLVSGGCDNLVKIWRQVYIVYTVCQLYTVESFTFMGTK